MRDKIIIVILCLALGEIAAEATSIYIPGGSFEGLTNTVTAPTYLGLTVIGTNTGLIGPWSVSVGSTIGLLNPCSIISGQDLDGTTPSAGTYDVQISLPLGVGNSVSLSQTLTNTFKPNSIYTLSVCLDQGTVAGLLSSGDIELRSGTTTLDALSGNNLLSLMDDNNGFQTISMTYQTGNVAPTGDISIYFSDSSVATVAGNVFLDNWQLNVVTAPEPNSEGFILLGALLMIWIIRRPANGCFQNKKTISASFNWTLKWLHQLQTSQMPGYASKLYSGRVYAGMAGSNKKYLIKIL